MKEWKRGWWVGIWGVVDKDGMGGTKRVNDSGKVVGLALRGRAPSRGRGAVVVEVVVVIVVVGRGSSGS